MSLDVVMAAIAGYSDRLMDQELLAVQAGYWSAYYSNSKHPKSVKDVSDIIMRSHKEQLSGNTKASVSRPDVDVEAFLAQEARFKAAMKAR